jgi:predicted enzyme related to lactoylglutathione lyase
VYKHQTADEEEDFNTYLADVRTNGGKLHFPPFYVRDFSRLKQIVTCEAFKLTAKYVFIVIAVNFITI